MASLKEIAERAGVSIATVSRALNDTGSVSPHLRSRVLREARQIGHEVATATPVGGGRIAIGYPGVPYYPGFGTFDAAVVSGVSRAAFEQRWDVAMVDLSGDKRERETYTQMLRRKGVDAVVVRTVTEKRGICERLASEGFPAVVLADRFDDPRVNFVAYDSRRPSERAIEHLLHLGHERIAVCVHAVRDVDHADRCEAYRAVLGLHGLPVPEEFIVEIIASPEGGASAVSRLLSLPRPPTAIFFTDPLSTVGGLRRAHEMGVKVPEEVSIVGFDDGELRKLSHPVFTAVCQDAESLAYSAAMWLMGRGPARSSESSLREVREAYFEVNGTTSVAPTEAVRVAPDGRRLRPVEPVVMRGVSALT